MQKRADMKIKLILFVAIFIIFISFSASAGFFDWIKNPTITGHSISQPTNISITVTGINPVRIKVWNNSLVGTGGDGIDPIENGTSLVLVNVTVWDPDGASDINTTSVNITIKSVTGESRYNSSYCIERTGESNNTAKNFTCEVEMWYFDADGTWNITITATDKGNGTNVTINNESFSYKQLKALVIAPNSLTWPSVSPGNTNKTSDNDPTIINNTGNYNATGRINITGVNLYGTSTVTEFINVANFSIGVTTGGAACSGDACTECAGNAVNGTILLNGTQKNIKGTILNKGNLSLSQANETIFYCIIDVPSSVSSQIYDTTTTGSWTIQIY